ncbi:MAG TPA: cadherin-like domain-containing protein, partial [Verrucomicrobiae bacterium]
MKKILSQICRAALCGLVLAARPAAAQIVEPDTVFYGQVINRTSGQIDLLTSGTMTWTIQRPDGQLITASAELQRLNYGAYSYRLAVPHEVMTYGLTVDADVVPLAASAGGCTLVAMNVDGHAAVILPPGTGSFVVGQSLRAATYRLDLELTNQLGSTSGDGLPDWWKTAFGINDPNGITSADGWSNLQKFRNGGTPFVDNRYPSLLTAEYWAYADGSTELPLTVVDSDSTTTNVVFTLKSLPSNGSFYLRNFSNDVPLNLGAQFTLADVNQGRLIFAHGGPTVFAGPVSFRLGLGDETPSHATNYTVWLNTYRPNYPDTISQAAQAAANAPFGFADISGLSFGEQQMLINYYLSRDHGNIIADASRFALSRTNQAALVSSDRTLPHVFVGGTGNDRLVGGAGNDILIGGRGDDILRGNGGRNLFLVSGINTGNEVIEDFGTNNLDALDISRALVGTDWHLTNYVQLKTDGTNSYLG